MRPAPPWQAIFRCVKYTYTCSTARHRAILLSTCHRIYPHDASWRLLQPRFHDDGRSLNFFVIFPFANFFRDAILYSIFFFHVFPGQSIEQKYTEWYFYQLFTLVTDNFCCRIFKAYEFPCRSTKAERVSTMVFIAIAKRYTKKLW